MRSSSLADAIETVVRAPLDHRRQITAPAGFHKERVPRHQMIVDQETDEPGVWPGVWRIWIPMIHEQNLARRIRSVDARLLDRQVPDLGLVT